MILRSSIISRDIIVVACFYQGAGDDPETLRFALTSFIDANCQSDTNLVDRD